MGVHDGCVNSTESGRRAFPHMRAGKGRTCAEKSGAQAEGWALLKFGGGGERLDVQLLRLSVYALWPEAHYSYTLVS
jgi:hypothetical protein